MKKVLVLAMAMAMALMSVGALAESRLAAQGTGVVTVNADRATISLGVQEVAPDVVTAQSAVNEKIEAVIAALNEIGQEGNTIATSGIGIYANYDYSISDERVGYTAYNSVVVTVTDVDNVGAYIDAAFAAGANDLDYVQFYAADTEAALDEALALAVQNAQHRAQTMAEAAGVELGELLEIRDGSTGSSLYDGYARAEMDAGAGTQVLPSQQQVSASVILIYAVK